AEREQLVELLVERREVRGLAGDQVPVEGLDMPEIEHQPVTLRDRALVERFGTQQREQTIGLGPGLIQAAGEGVAFIGEGQRVCHIEPPMQVRSWMRARRRTSRDSA